MATNSSTPSEPEGQKIEIKYGEWISQAFDTYKENFGTLIIVSLLFTIIYIIAMLLCVVPVLIIGGPLTAGFYLVCSKLRKKEEGKVGDLFAPFQTHFMDTLIPYIVIVLVVGIVAFILSVILGFIPILGQILSIVLGLIAGGVGGILIVFSLMSVLEGKKSGSESIGYAYSVLMRDPVNLTLYGALAALLGQIGLVLCVVGVILTAPIAILMLLVLYNEVEGSGDVVAVEEEPAEPVDQPEA